MESEHTFKILIICYLLVGAFAVSSSSDPSPITYMIDRERHIIKETTLLPAIASSKGYL